MRIRAVAPLLAVVLVTAACGSTDEEETGSQVGGELTVAAPEAPTSLDPIGGSNGGDHVSLYPIYDRLINFDPETMEPQPGLAVEWASPDPETLVLTLREGVTFHDGTALDAEAVKFNLERALDPETSSAASDVGNIDSVEVTGPHEVTLHLKAPDASLVLTLADRAGMIASPTAVEEHGEDFSLNPVGSGPFAFDSYAVDDALTLQRNEDYWGEGEPSLDTITISYFSDQQTANNALQSGQVDVILNADLAALSALEGMSGVEVTTAPSLLTEGCYINFTREPFNNVDARRALAHAIDREALNEAYAFGEASPTSQIFPVSYWAADPDLNDTFTHDPDAARDFLEAGGYADGVSVTGIAVQGTGEIRKFEIIQEQLKEIGMDMEFDVLDPAAAASAFFADKSYDFVCSAWTGRPDPSQTATSLFGETSFYNLGGYTPPGMEDALDAATAAQGQEERAAAFSEINELNQEYVVWLPLLSEPDVTAFSDKVEGLEPNLLGKIDVSFLSLAQ